MDYTNQPTVVASVLVCVGYSVMAEMTDGSVITLSCPWGCPDEGRVNNYWSGWKNRTHAQLVELARDHNADRRHGSNNALHLDKVRRLGHDYASRGY